MMVSDINAFMSSWHIFDPALEWTVGTEGSCGQDALFQLLNHSSRKLQFIVMLLLYIKLSLM